MNTTNTQRQLETDPYGALGFCIGSADDFFCYDYDIDGDRVRLHAVINSETGSFIMNAEEPAEVSRAEAIAKAQGLVDQAINWLAGEGIDDPVEHDTEGWNQDPQYFVRWVTYAIDRKNHKKPDRIVVA